jgi:hypothetical protein
VPLECACDAEIRKERLALDQEYVVGLEVAMHDTTGVSVVERVGNLAHHPRAQLER